MINYYLSHNLLCQTCSRSPVTNTGLQQVTGVLLLYIKIPFKEECESLTKLSVRSGCSVIEDHHLLHPKSNK
ncbi:hypothetical protein HanRHA438_Chr06g0259401 [Helianthus annuus]|nr:hypothetical protein HanRHA438_Chr06g0259401 [Helianthus annuus]